MPYSLPLALATCLGLMGTALATPVYYTFSGTVSNVHTDGAMGYAETSEHFAVGQAVTLVFMADKDLGGFSGQVLVFSGPAGAVNREFNNFSLTLTDISSTAPVSSPAVPEPGSLAMLAVGCIGLAAARLTAAR